MGLKVTNGIRSSQRQRNQVITIYVELVDEVIKKSHNTSKSIEFHILQRRNRDLPARVVSWPRILRACQGCRRMRLICRSSWPLFRISCARSVTEIIVVIGKGIWVCLKELCARAERKSQNRQNKYSHHLAIDRYLLIPSPKLPKKQ